MNLTVQTNQGPMVLLNAVTCGVPGLVVHRGAAGRGWFISHRASGLALSGRSFPTRAMAIKAARGLANLTDWSVDGPTLSELARTGRLGRSVSVTLTAFGAQP